MRRSGPQPSVIADLGGVQEVVERDEGLRQLMLIRRDRRSKLSQIGVAIADFQVTQNLVVRPVFLDDEDHVLDALTHGCHDRGVARALGAGEPVVGGYLRRQRRELRRTGAREVLQAGLGQLGIILIRGIAIRRIRRPVTPITPAGIRARRRLRIYHVHRIAIAAEAH